MRVLDLFSGIGGFSLGLERAGFTTVAFCEIEPFCRKVLAKHWPNVKQYTDVRTLTAEQLRADGISVDVICGGFPCQPYSAAGKRLGGEDDRALWPEYFRLIKELRPTWVIGENVVGLITLGLDNVLADLESVGYATRTFDIPACAVGAPHERRRVWIVANPSEIRFTSQIQCWNDSQGYEKRFPRASLLSVDFDGHGSAEDSYGVRKGDGFSEWMDRINACGNAVVPQIPELIGRAILNAERKAA